MIHEPVRGGSEIPCSIDYQVAKEEDFSYVGGFLEAMQELTRESLRVLIRKYTRILIR